MPQGLPVQAVVVNYNAAPLLGGCVASLRAAGVGDVVVVDNASTDGSRRLLAEADPGARWIDTGANLGYGRAANRGARQSGRPYVLICNPDLELGPDTVRILVDRLEAEPDLGVIGPRVVNPDGTTYPSARTFPDLVDSVGHGLLGMVAPGNRFTRRYRLLDRDDDRPARVGWVSGACFLIRRTVWDALGGFDPAYFMYLEDVDLCWRAQRAGWAVGYEPTARVTHVQGVSTDRHPYRMLLAHHRSMWRFAWRTTAGPKRAALPLVGAGLAGRVLVAWAAHRFGPSGPPPARGIP
ncbi:MAG: glycosyltransferase family 2 protein [Acidimicrobiales bacterium]